MYAPDIEAKYADVGYWKERAFIAEQMLETEKRIMRDDFAMAALTGQLANPYIMKAALEDKRGIPAKTFMAELSYAYADGMLAVREEKP